MTPAEEVFDWTAPPTQLLDYLDKLFKVKTDKGETIPYAFIMWRQAWAEIYGDGPALTDKLTAEDWIELKKLVKVPA